MDAAKNTLKLAFGVLERARKELAAQQ